MRTKPACGTDSGYQAHRRHGEQACDACRVAHAEVIRGQRVAAGATPRGPVAAHGTRSAYERERRAFRAGTGPAPCDECRQANRQR